MIISEYCYLFYQIDYLTFFFLLLIRQKEWNQLFQDLQDHYKYFLLLVYLNSINCLVFKLIAPMLKISYFGYFLKNICAFFKLNILYTYFFILLQYPFFLLVFWYLIEHFKGNPKLHYKIQSSFHIHT